MSAQKKKPQEPTAEVDWAERLKAAMNESPAESPPPAPASEEDDLAALLRAQLARRDETADVGHMDLDTREFEEDPWESVVSEPKEEPVFEVVFEPEAISESEEVFEKHTECVGVPEPTSSIAGDDLPWEDTDALPLPEDDDLPWEDGALALSENEEDDEIIPDELPEPITVTVYRAEPPHSIAEEEPSVLWNEDAESGSEEEPWPVEPIAPAADTALPSLAEDFAYLSPDGDVGNSRLQAADALNTLLLKEEGVFDESEEDTEDVVFDESTDSGTGATIPATTRSAGEKTPHPTSVVHPMQLGLDDVVPVVTTLPPMDLAPPRRKSPPSDYTARMRREAREVSAKDTDLYLHLGYEEKLTRSEEQAAVEEARRRAHEREDAAKSREGTPSGDRREFTDRRQTPAIDRAYTRATRLNAVRLCVAAVGALFGILYGYLGILSAPISSFTFSDTLLYPLLGVIWTVIACLPFLSRLFRGLGSLMAFEPTRYAVSALALCVSLVNDSIAIFTHGSHLFGGVALLMLAVASLSEFLANEGERAAFSVVSAGKTSFVLTNEITPAAVCHGETAPSESTLTAVRTGRLADYFARTGKYNPYTGRLNYLLPAALLCAILCAGIAALTGTETVGGVASAFTACYLICLPSAYLLAMNLPLFAANRLLCKKGAAVVGVAAPTDYAKKGSTRLLFRDGDALGGLQRKEITLRDDPDTPVYRQKAAKLFRLMECPLWNESPLGEDDTAGLCLEVAESGEGFVRLYLVDLTRNETTEVMMGSHADLSRRGIRLPKPAMEKTYKKTESSQVIYLAFDGQFRLAYSVEYRVGKTFVRAVKKLATLGDTASLSTYDPLVDVSLLDVASLKDQPPVSILHPTYVESVRASRSSGVIATGRSLDLLYPYTACRRMKSLYRITHAASWISLLLGAGMSALLIGLGYGGLLSAAAVMVWQMLLSAAAVAVTLLRVNGKTLFLRTDKKKAAPQKTTPDGDKQP